MTLSQAARRLTVCLLLATCGASAQMLQQGAAPALAGTSWQLVRFQGSDDTTRTPDDGAKYTIAFGTDGVLNVRLDCNRGRGTWKSGGPSQLEFGPLALTRAMCPPGSLHDQIVKHWNYIRSYVIREKHLFLSLMADGGIYEFEPMAGGASSAYVSPVASTGPVTYQCTSAQATGETLRATFYKTQPAMVLVERGGVVRPAFQVVAASGARYEGDALLFWDARGEASVTWSGIELTCKRR